jgi:hypothetical protein
MGGIVLIKEKGKWKVEEWKNGKAPEHDHFFLDPSYVDKIGYPILEEFSEGSGILIGHRLKLSGEQQHPLSYFFLDGIRLLEKSNKTL